MGNEKRARDVDRDLAVDFVEAAWVDGQVTREEYDERVGRLLRARSIGDLERDVADLQGPDGAPWRPAGAVPPPARVTSAGRVSPPSHATPPAPAERLRVVGVLVAVVVVAVMAVAGTVVSRDTSGVVDDSIQAVAVDGDSPLSAQGYRRLVEELDREVGETSAFDVRLQEHGAEGLFPAGPTGDAAQRRTWDGQTWSQPEETASPRERFNLQMISADTIEEAYVQASLALGPDALVELRLAVKTVAGVRSCLQATSSTPDGESITESYDCQGNLIDEETDE